MDVSYLAASSVYSGATNELRFVTLPMTLTKNDTLLGFIVCHDLHLTPSVPDEWKLITNVDGVSGSTYLYINQPTGTTINPTYVVGNLSNKLNCGFILRFSGCTYHSSKTINAYVSQANTTGTGSSSGFDTTVDNTMLIQFVGLFRDGNLSNFSSDPSLTWTERRESGFTHTSYTVHAGAATSSLSPIDNYKGFDYSYSISTENIVTIVALTPRQSNVIMSSGFL